MQARGALVFLFYAPGINGVRTSLQGVPDGDPRGPIATIGQWWLLPDGARRAGF